MTVQCKEWRELATETAEKLEVARADVILQLKLREAAREEMDT